jgi:bifunctional ADP-heptose synthase (sugar kinase/adenylyltransferase)
VSDHDRVIVVGDVILDEYTYSKKLGVSAETPTIVGELSRVDRYVGGAGLVARHLVRLGCPVDLVCIGPEFVWNWGDVLPLTLWREDERGWNTVVKRRYYVDDYKICQIDVLNKAHHTEDSRQRLYERVKSLTKQSKDGRSPSIVVCDNGHGTIDRDLLKSIIALGNRVYVDCQISQKRDDEDIFSAAKNCHVIFLNSKEYDFLCERLSITETRFEFGIKRISDFLGADVVLKLGKDGVRRILAGGAGYYKVPGEKVEVVDTCGAGDAFLASYVANGGDLIAANHWAALSCTYRGTVVPDVEKL